MYIYIYTRTTINPYNKMQNAVALDRDERPAGQVFGV